MACTRLSPQQYAFRRYVGILIYRLRMRRGLTQMQLAWRVGVSVRGLQRIEAGVRVLRVDTAVLIAAALEVSICCLAPPDWLKWHSPRPRPLVDLLPLRMRRAVYRGLGRGVAHLRWLRLGR